MRRPNRSLALCLWGFLVAALAYSAASHPFIVPTTEQPRFTRWCAIGPSTEPGSNPGHPWLQIEYRQLGSRDTRWTPFLRLSQWPGCDPAFGSLSPGTIEHPTIFGREVETRSVWLDEEYEPAQLDPDGYPVFHPHEARRCR